MTWVLKHKVYVAVAGIIVYLLWSNRKAVAASVAGPEMKRGRVDSGSTFGYFDVNPDSATFGEKIFGTYGWED